MFDRLSLKTILIGGAILAAVIPAVLVGIVLVGSLHGSMTRAATERYEVLAKGLASEYDQFLRSHRQALLTLADHVEEYRTFGERSVAPLVARTRARYPALDVITIVDPSGRIVVSDPREPRTVGALPGSTSPIRNGSVSSSEAAGSS